MQNLSIDPHPNTGTCASKCKGCGKVHIKIIGDHSYASKLLNDRVREALTALGMPAKIVEVTDSNIIHADKQITLPALLIEDHIVSQGTVPEVSEITQLLLQKDLFKSKLFRLRTLSVPVDMSDVSANALIFAWQIARHTNSNIEVVNVVDSVFEGNSPTSTGFLANYGKSIQAELDTFISETLKKVGVNYVPAHATAGAPNEPNTRQQITSKIMYGMSDTVLEDYSQTTDLIVIGATGRGRQDKAFFGSISIEVSKRAHCPVLIIPMKTEFIGFEHLLYASDFESLHTLSVQQVISFAKRFEAQTHFVHVGPGGERNLLDQYKYFEETYADTQSKRPFLFHKIVSDDVIGGLYEYSFYHRINLLVFVTHQRSFWDGILHKSITNEALLTSDLPILIIHSDDDSIII